ncbi:hypothetical protein IU404_02480 (plasmid) [Limosilactobacillus reuteri]|nr:hypothetical protein IU404_02409 [Limosilactobacillus reuteri]UFK67011.1 hypothetical protein IU404_02480 [Limosilactobacillus reuteri]UFK69032.1 hypothetical protein IVR12_02142 [Limosilactobacillus reuteri]
MIFNYDKLKDRMQQLRYNQVSLAKATNIERVTLNRKINNRIMFKQDEILSIANALDIGSDEIGVYFFTLIVKKR